MWVLGTMLVTTQLVPLARSAGLARCDEYYCNKYAAAMNAATTNAAATNAAATNDVGKVNS